MRLVVLGRSVPTKAVAGTAPPKRLPSTTTKDAKGDFMVLWVCGVVCFAAFVFLTVAQYYTSTIPQHKRSRLQ